jgi:8-oxo-dGTP pyrophosphatase MutT (NUDIX family)
MRRRIRAGLLVVRADTRVLLFRYVFTEGPLAGGDYWATAGGGVEDSETIQQAAIRELKEETGFDVTDPGPVVARREVTLQMPDGEHLISDEYYFRIGVPAVDISRAGWTAHERNVTAEHHWWSRSELLATADTVYPEDLLGMLGWDAIENS